MDAYELLGLPRDASMEEVEATFKSIKEMTYPGVPTETVPNYMIKSPQFAEIQKAYRQLKKDQKALEKIAEVKATELMANPNEELSFSSVYGKGAINYRADGDISADDSKLKTGGNWQGDAGDTYKVMNQSLTEQTRGITGLKLEDHQAATGALSFGPGPRTSYPGISDNEELNPITEFLDFSMFDLSGLGQDGYYYHSAMTFLQDNKPDAAMVHLRKVENQNGFWDYLVAMAKALKGEFVEARYNAVRAYGAEVDNLKYWGLLKFIEPRAEAMNVRIDREAKETSGYKYEKRQNRKLIFLGILTVAAVLVTLYVYAFFFGRLAKP